MRHYLKETKETNWLQHFKSAQKAFEADGNHLWAGMAANHVSGELRLHSKFKQSITTYQQAIEHFIQAKAPA